MKKCLVVIQNLSKSGSPQTFLHVIKTLKGINFSVDLFAFSILDDNDLYFLNSYEKLCDKIIFSRVKMNGITYKLFPFLVFNKVKTKLRKNDYDLVLTNNIYFSAYCLKHKNKNLKSKIIYYSLGRLDIRSRFVLLRKKERYIKKQLSSIDAFIALSSFTFLKDVPIPKEKQFVLMDYPNLFYPEIHKEYRNNGRPILRIGQIGYFCANKNQIFTLRVFEEIKKVNTEAELYYMGYVFADEKKYYGDFLKELSKSSVKGSVKMLPSDYDKKDFFQLVDVLVLPSHHEGLSLTLLEAQFSNTYCIASLNVPPDVEFGNCDRLPLLINEWVDLINEEKYKKIKNISNNYGQNEFSNKLRTIIEKTIK